MNFGNETSLLALASAMGYQSQSRELNENYWPSDGYEYRSCQRCGATEKCSRGAAPRVCVDCDDPDLMEVYEPTSYAWLFAA